MSSSFANKTNEQNLKLRNSYRRYFIWGSKEKPGFGKGLKNPKRNYSLGLRTKLKKADAKRINRIISILLIFFTVIIIVGYIVWKL